MDLIKVAGRADNGNLCASGQAANGAVVCTGAGAHVQAGGNIDDAGLVHGRVSGIGCGFRQADIVLGDIAGAGSILNLVEVTGFADNRDLGTPGQGTDGAVICARAGAHVQAGGNIDDAGFVHGRVSGIGRGLRQADIVLGDIAGAGSILNLIEVTGFTDNRDLGTPG